MSVRMALDAECVVVLRFCSFPFVLPVHTLGRKQLHLVYLPELVKIHRPNPALLSDSLPLLLT